VKERKEGEIYRKKESEKDIKEEKRDFKDKRNRENRRDGKVK